VQKNTAHRVAYSVTEVIGMQLLPLGRSAIYEGCRTGAIPTIRVGHKYLIPVWWLDGMATGSAAE